MFEDKVALFPGRRSSGGVETGGRGCGDGRLAAGARLASGSDGREGVNRCGLGHDQGLWREEMDDRGK